MEKAVEATQFNFATVRTGRANPAVLDRVMVRWELGYLMGGVGDGVR